MLEIFTWEDGKSSLPLRDDMGIHEKWLSATQPRTHLGWSIISQVPMNSEIIPTTARLLRAAREDYPLGAWSQHPFSSLHITVANGFKLRSYLGQEDIWPPDFSREMSFQEAFARVLRTVQGAELPNVGPIQWRAVGISPLEKGFNLNVEPLEEEMRERVQAFRRATYTALGMTPSDIETFQFHITIAYQLANFDEELRAFHESRRAHYEALIEQAPSFRVEQPAVCMFADMFSFPPLHYFE